MKKLEFKTSKGSFLLSDENYYLVNERAVKTAYLNNVKQFEYVSFIRLSEITEQQASEIVDKKIGYKNYLESTDVISNYSCVTAIKSLHSLLKSKGVYLYENPVYKDVEYSDELCKYCPLIKKGVYSVNGGYVAGCEGSCCETAKENHEDMYQEVEQKTFYNPVIFKL